MRNILFKGKAIESKEWIYGNYVSDGTDVWILPLDSAVKIQVIPETVCQSLEIQDKNSKNIFDKDIIVTYYKGRMCSVGYIEYSDAEYDYNLIFGSIFDECETISLLRCEYSMIVIGNIYDNQDIIDKAKTLKDFYDKHYTNPFVCSDCPTQHICNNKYNCMDFLLSIITN